MLEHSYAFQMLKQHIDQSFETSRQEFRVIWDEKLNEQRKEIESKIEVLRVSIDRKFLWLITFVVAILGTEMGSLLR